jgi:hypothetical protein
MSNLIRLIYVSRANFEPTNNGGGIEPRVARILMQSRRNNPKKQVGGVLYFGDGCFFQCLEGQSDAVNALIAKIMQDERHSDVQILKVIPIGERIFRNWSMKYIPLESDVSALLKKHKMDSFNPYEFSDELTDDLIELFFQSSNPESQPDQNYIEQAHKKPSIWQKFLSMLGKRG